MEQIIICVDENDKIIGYGEKLEVHRQKQLHRAFSIFLYDSERDTYLIQRRAEGKYHSGGLWSNSCCSHPRKDEPMQLALVRRLNDELGISLPDDTVFLRAGTFRYFADYGSLAEHEIDHVFVLPYEETDDFSPNPEEIQDICWMAGADIKERLIDNPDQFSAWFPKAFELAERAIDKINRGGVDL